MQPDNYLRSVANETANEARSKALETATDVEFMKSDIERLLIITEALWTILKKEHGYSDDELHNAINQIDLRDGRLDGQVRKTEILKCPSCDRVVTIRQRVCIYCGQRLAHDPFAR